MKGGASVVALDIGGGRRLHVDPDDGRARMLIETGGNFNAGSKEIWRRLADSAPWDLVVDVGANYGEMLLELPQGLAGKIVAFEPNPSLLPYLDATIADAGLSVDVVPQALSDERGSVTFLVDKAWSGQSRLGTASDESADLVPTTVAATTLDEYFFAEPVRRVCIKIDVEGAERSVLRGGRLMFSRAEEVAVMIEILHMPAPDIAALAGEWRMFMLDLRTGRLIRVGPDVGHVEELLRSGWCYPQDAVLVAADARGRRPW